MKSTRRYKKWHKLFGIIVFALLVGAISSSIFIARTTADQLENGAEVELDSELTYYINVKYDGVDVFGTESSDAQMANITSNRIKVTDKLPQGLIFKSFVTTSDGSIGAISRSDHITRCGGKVFDDTHEESLTEGKWNDAHTEYTYHGLHYNANTREVSFYAENVKAGCELTVGIITKTPAAVDDPETDPVEIRRDFYNIARGVEGDLTKDTDPVHTWIGRDNATMYKVSYNYTGDIPDGAPTAPSEQNYAKGAAINVVNNPALKGYTFSGWQTEDAQVNDGVFVMPEQAVVFTGTFVANPEPTTYTVTYEIDGEKPSDFILPKTKEYEANTEVVLDSTSADVISGYAFSGWSSSDVELSETGFIMPAKNVIIRGSFEQIKHTVSYSFQGEIMPPNASSLLPAVAQYAPGEEVTVAANPTAEGYRFTGWYKAATFVMPDEDVVISGEWMREVGTFLPNMSMRVINRKDKFVNNDTVEFEITITNTEDFDLIDVFVEEELEGATFADSEDYDLETGTIAKVPRIPAGGTVKLKVTYPVHIDEDTKINNKVRLIGASAENDYNLNTEQEVFAEADFDAILKPIDKIIPKIIPNANTLDNIGKFVLILIISAVSIWLIVQFNRHENLKKTAKKVLPVFGISASIAFISAIGVKTFADMNLNPIESIELASTNASYEDEDAGAWKVKKSAKWTSKTTAQITFEINSIPKLSGNEKDIVLVLDNSTSMQDKISDDGSSITKLEAVKRNVGELIHNSLDNQNTQIALVSFATDAELLVPFTNNIDDLTAGLGSMTAYGSTNYYKALTKVEEALRGYEEREGRDVVVLFITDGMPVKQTPQEVIKYATLKANYPKLIVNSIQYDMGDTPIEQLTQISDNQFIVSDAGSLDKILFEAASVPYYYKSFNIADYVDGDYWDTKSVNATLGSASIDGNEVTWDLGRYFRPSQENPQKLTINLGLKEEFHEADDRWPTNVKETAASTILDGADENVSSTSTPVLQHKYNVSYDANLPSVCTSDINLPETERYFVFDAVEIQAIDLSCEGWNFMGWEIATPNVNRINTDYFRMPAADVILRAVWTKFDIEKHMEGQVHEKVSATFDTGTTVNLKIKRLSGQTTGYNTTNTTITAIKRADKLSADINTSDSAYRLSSAGSQAPIYAWYDDGIVYYYTEADVIYTGDSAFNMFSFYSNLVDISGLSDINLTKTTDASYMLQYNSSLKDLTPIANWDLSNTKNISGMFQYDTALDDITPLADWDLSSTTNISYLFRDDSSLVNISGVEEWDVSQVTDTSYMFSSTGINNLNPLADWNVSRVQNMSYMFSYNSAIKNLDALLEWDTASLTNISHIFYNMTGLQNVNGLANWNTSKVTELPYVFYGASSLVDISGISDWDVSNVETMEMTFTRTALQNVDALSGWDTSKLKKGYWTFTNMYYLENLDGLAGWDTTSLTDMTGMFGGNCGNCTGNRSLTDISGIRGWDTSKVTTMQALFSNNRNLSDFSPISGWNTSKVSDMTSMFYNTSIQNTNAISEWDTSSLTKIAGMFDSARSLVDVSGLAGFNTSKVTSLSSLFDGATSLTNLHGLEGWDTSKITSLYRTFSSMTKLTDMSAVAGWDTSSVKDMGGILYNSTSLTNLDAFAGWDTSSLTSLADSSTYAPYRYAAFASMTSLQNVNGLSQWDTSRLVNIRYLFYGDKMLSDISGLAEWDTSSATKMDLLFYQNTALVDISPLENWDTSKVTTMNYMFGYDTAINDLSPLENWDTTNLDIKDTMFYNIPTSIERPSWF